MKMDTKIQYKDLYLQVIPLPDDIAREVSAGRYSIANEMIALRLADDRVPEIMKKRLLIEQDVMRHNSSCYTMTAEEVVEEMIETGVKDFTMEELKDLRMKGVVDWRYMDGEIRYINSLAETLTMTNAAYKKRLDPPAPGRTDPITPFLAELEEGDIIYAHIPIRHTLYFHDEFLEEGKTLTVHMPIPKDGINDQMKNIKIKAMSHEPFALAEGDSLQPTVVFKEKAHKGIQFYVEYELDHEVTYHDLTKSLEVAMEDDKDGCQKKESENLSCYLGECLPENVSCYLGERFPHVAFTPYLRMLAKEICGEENNLLKKARLIYDYVTTKIVYRFVPDYAAINNVAEYCALNGYGDCGVQALLFITLCRISGIPAKWQSGICAELDRVGEHDWAQFYLPEYGWLFADLSFGGSAYRAGEVERWNYYFGNISPLRIPLNEEFSEEFTPGKRFLRHDPCDSQSGEAEYEDAPCLRTCYEREYENQGIQIYLAPKEK